MQDQDRQEKKAMFISFDAVAVSGITVEAMKIALLLQERSFHSYLDLGYDIKIDKGNFNKSYDKENDIYRDVFELVRIDGIMSIPNYNLDFIRHVHDALISQKILVNDEEKIILLHTIDQTASQLAEHIVAQWEKLGVSNVVVENGTLPENIIYTKALYLAIEHYGQRHALTRFVIWRDHDLMWNSERTTLKYGFPPYSHAVKPSKSKHITYVTLNHDLKQKLEAWCDDDIKVQVKKNTYDFSEQKARINIRERLGVGEDDILIARTTRIISQKRLDRDLVLVSRLNHLFQNDNNDRCVYLAIAGNEKENLTCCRELQKLARELRIEPYIKFVGMLPHECIRSANDAICIEDLYYSCDLVSFLTSYDYDSYGNPIGEAVSHRRCYITTSYEYYHEVYGQHGFEAPVMRISEKQDGLPTAEFVNELYQFLNNKERMQSVAEKNFALGKKVLSNNIIEFLNAGFEVQ
ncbi:glycosyl transferase family 2 [Yersinia sp. Marseille-Q3913]|uniref:glycosyl transferase family 2 n=1 Tax=Yersinia sp. Marseille-Q3913 TaxID=2830769 RepID=UPI001BAFF5DF|nr:glycosyl transferase family 2 [Yersinia sp. Marseille-Q3913]MBS0055898.1 glycosyl transferase family 2 [Yersinia sp. Marseille-Q3913]